jgi:hypothetical protein
MKVKDWIEMLSEMDPEYEVLAPDKGGSGKWIPVIPVETQETTGKLQIMNPIGPFVKIVREREAP